MLVKTQGIVLKTFSYSESSVIAKVYTEHFGLKSYLIHGVRKRKAKTKANNLQLLSLLDLEVYNRANKDLQHIKELKSAYLFQTLPYDIRKSSIGLFINELIYNSIREEEANSSLFHFLLNSIQLLDLVNDNFSTFHLHFAIQLTKYLGFGPAELTYHPDYVFDLADGKFHRLATGGLYCLNKEESLFFFQATSFSFDKFQEMSFLKSLRKAVLEKVLTYYQLHLPEFKSLHSHEVLEHVLA